MNNKQDKLTFPFEENSDGLRVVSDDSIARRLVGDGKIRVMGVLDFLNGGSITDIQIGLDTNLTRLANYYTKQELDSQLESAPRIKVFKYPHMC